MQPERPITLLGILRVSFRISWITRIEKYLKKSKGFGPDFKVFRSGIRNFSDFKSGFRDF